MKKVLIGIVVVLVVIVVGVVMMLTPSSKVSDKPFVKADTSVGVGVTGDATLSGGKPKISPSSSAAVSSVGEVSSKDSSMQKGISEVAISIPNSGGSVQGVGDAEGLLEKGVVDRIKQKGDVQVVSGGDTGVVLRDKPAEVSPGSKLPPKPMMIKVPLHKKEDAASK